MPKGVRPRGRVSQGEGGLACTGRGDGRLHRRGARGTGSLGEGGSTSSGPGEGPLGGVRPRRGEPPRERGLTRVSRGSTASETVALVAKGSRGEGHSGGLRPLEWPSVGRASGMAGFRRTGSSGEGRLPLEWHSIRRASRRAGSRKTGSSKGGGSDGEGLGWRGG